MMYDEIYFSIQQDKLSMDMREALDTIINHYRDFDVNNYNENEPPMIENSLPDPNLINLLMEDLKLLSFKLRSYSSLNEDSNNALIEETSMNKAADMVDRIISKYTYDGEF